MTVSLELVRAREEQGLSREELAKRTGLSVQWLTAIEEVDVDHLPGMLFLRSYVSAFAAEVGLDPDIASDRYMAQLKHRSALDEFASEESTGLEPICVTTSDVRTESVFDPSDAFPREVSPGAWARPSALVGYAALVVVTLVTLTGLVFLSAPQSATRDVPLNTSALHQTITVDVSEFDEKTTIPSEPRQTGELTGSWMLTSHVERSSLFKDLTLGFRLQLDQTGNRVRGRGLKWTENGQRVALGARTPITIDGTIEDGRLVLAFTERGTRRTSRGTLSLKRAADGSLHGSFSTDAARSSGRAQAVRLTSAP